MRQGFKDFQAVVRPPPPVFSLDIRPSNPSVYDDEFDGLILSGKWVDPTTTAAGQTNLIIFHDSWMRLEPATTGTASTGKHVFGIHQLSPTASFTVSARLADLGEGTDIRAGIFVSVGGAKGHVVGPFKQDGQLAYIGVTTVSNSADWSGYDAVLTTIGGGNWAPTWIRLRWDSSAGTLYYDWSQNGTEWRLGNSRASLSQPTQMGICIYANSGVIQANAAILCDWFRVIPGTAAFTSTP